MRQSPSRAEAVAAGHVAAAAGLLAGGAHRIVAVDGQPTPSSAEIARFLQVR